MSFFNHTDQLTPDPATGLSKPSFWRRALDAVAESRRREAQQILADLVVRNGGHMTDDVERQISLML